MNRRKRLSWRYPWDGFAYVWRLVGPLVLAFGPLGLCSLACSDLGPSLCGNRLLADYPAPDGRMKVVVFGRDCGATTGFTTQASVVGIDAPLTNDAGNTLIVDDNHGACPPGAGGGPELRIRWAAADRVVIAHPLEARVFRAETSHDSVTIQYEVY